LPGKVWTLEEETMLREMAQAGEKADVIAAKLGRNRDAVMVKARRLNVRVVGEPLGHTTTSDLKLPPELPTPEEALKVLAAALQASKEKGLDKVEVERLKAVAQLARTYDALLDKYVGYRKIEEELIRLDEKYRELVEREKAREPQQVSSGQEP
jgi:hypothetical protein